MGPGQDQILNPVSAARHVATVSHVTDSTTRSSPFEWRFAEGLIVARFYMLTELVACSGVVFTQSVATISRPMKCHLVDVSLIGRR